jgi:hypothetical protein
MISSAFGEVTQILTYMYKHLAVWVYSTCTVTHYFRAFLRSYPKDQWLSCALLSSTVLHGADNGFLIILTSATVGRTRLVIASSMVRYLINATGVKEKSEL